MVKRKKPFIVVLWHGKMLLPMYIHRSQNISVMVSEHRDGEMIARSVHRIGYTTVRGSSTRGGSKAVRQMVRQLKNGDTCVILPDGPKGPRHKVKMGVVMIAQLAGADIIPLTFSAAKPISLKSWDRFTFWWPFSKLCMVYGKPIRIPRRMEEGQMEEYRRLIENSLNNLQKEADGLFQA
ncbi:lysophospholipid acyltransferase family protein [candidate division KSB1 bacterium]|nr:lysophospholipid acyltransferase family protein [candidate division KSB1 bacterium]